MLESVPKHEVAGYLSILDAAIINLRKSELFTTVIPSKIFETSAMQIPILLGVDGESRAIVEAFGAGLYYEPENESDFVAKVNQLFTDTSLYTKCKEGGAKLALAFDRKILANKMLSTINELIQTK
jgi:glycosyltransferase involved in cell wall biosynthesis